MGTFTAETFQNEYLAVGASEVDAIVTVTASGGGAAIAKSAAAEIIIVDTSGSMKYPRANMRAAREATAAAIDCLEDGVEFAVIAGDDEARCVYPTEARLAAATATSRAEAKDEVARLQPDGGTAMGKWLLLANEAFATSPDTRHHAILLTDGYNQHESADDLDRALKQCTENFQCDCRGIGTDWEVKELRRIASALLGTVDIVASPDDLEADFRGMIERALGRETDRVSLRLWTPRGAEVAFVKQVAPTIEDLTGRGTLVDELTADYPTGAWGDEERDYHLCIRVTPRGVGDEMLAARVGLVVGDEVASQSLIKATWTEDERLSTRINREVAHYTGQAELAEAIQDGLEARKAGDAATATFKLGRAVALATSAGNDATMRLLHGVVDVIDPVVGQVSLKPAIDDADEMALDSRSTKTVRVRRSTA